MRTSTLVGVIVLMVVAAACGSGATTTTTADSVTGTTTSTTIAATTTSTAITSTEPTSTTTTPPTTTTASAATTTVEAVVAYVEAWLADDFVATEPPEGLLGPSDVRCQGHDVVAVGGVLACSLVPNTSPELQLDEAGIVIYVLDGTGRSSWSVGTDIPSTTAGLAYALDFAGTDLMCRDLMDPDVQAGLFSGVGRPTASACFWSLVYWSLAGQPDRMDADLDGVPCETLHDAAIVTQVLAGGPVR